MQAHRGGVAAWQHQADCLALRRADGTEDVGRRVALVGRRRRPAATPRPAAGDLVLLSNPGFVCEPDLYLADADPLVARDRRHCLWPLFLNASMAPTAWLWCRGRADSLR